MDCVNDTTIMNDLMCLVDDNTSSSAMEHSALTTITGMPTNGSFDGEIPGFTFAYLLVPFLILEFGLSTFANVVLLILIGRSHESLTTLNVFLLSLGILNLILSVNQPVVLGLIFEKGRPFPDEICYVPYTIQTLGSYGIILLQIAISYNRYHTTLNPIHWESSRRKVWISIAIIWVLSFFLAGLFTVLQFSEIHGDTHYCLWPSFDAHIVFKIILHLLFYVISLTCVVITAYYYHKTIQLHKESRLAMEREMEMVADIRLYEEEQNSPEKTTKSLVAVFVIQIVAVITPLSYNILRAIIVAARSVATGDHTDPSPTVLLLFLTTFGLFVSVGPFFLLLVSRRFKENVVSIFKCKCKCVSNRVHLEHQCRTLEAHAIAVAMRPSMTQQDIDMSIFTGEYPSIKYKVPGSQLSNLTEEEGMEIQSLDCENDYGGGGMACGGSHPFQVGLRQESIKDFLEMDRQVQAILNYSAEQY